MTQLSSAIEWPPPYKIKKHRKAKYVRLRTSKTDGLIITVPFRFNLQEIPEVLERHKAWISKHLLQLAEKRSDELPHQINLQAINQTWVIHYMACNAKFEIFQRASREIVLLGKLPDAAVCKQKLIAWIKQQAHVHLVSQLQFISQLTQLNFENVIIRDQQTRWGSCSSQKSISLNYKLLFLPTSLMQHVLIHELCHTKHLNHSEKFWHLVASHDPNWQQHRRDLRRADQHIPGWI